jgi:sialate O-acetylesterase
MNAHRMLRFRRVLIVAACALAAAPPAGLAMAAPALPRIFSDNMVLQREQPIPVWGKAEPGEQITVSLGDVKATTRADRQGLWSLRLPPQNAGGPHTVTITGKDKNTTTFKNVMVGEVWICSGQSNMAWTVNHARNAAKEVEAARHPDIRLFGVKARTSPMPLTDVDGGPWVACTPETVASVSAVAYFFGRELKNELNVPIGLINTSWGGTAIEPWTPPIGFASVPKVQQYLEAIEKADREYIESLSKYLEQRKAWLAATRAIPVTQADNLTPAPFAPEHPFNQGGNGRPAAIYNAMVAPIAPYAIAGAIWYQGEANVLPGDGMRYHEKMKALINGWRATWRQGEFPFYYVQLAPWEYAVKYPGAADRLPEVWEAQTATLSVPNTGMAITNDIGNIRDIHPTNKQEVGRRLALWALARNYGRAGLVCSGPLYKSMKVEGERIRVQFDHAGGGLAARDGKPLTWFQIAGADGRFVDAKATIDGDSVLVSSEQVKSPTAVRFAWNELAEPNLANKEGLPAGPFRTGK